MKIGKERGMEFQLHHTGIKTRWVHKNNKINKNFNCTIQELKLERLFSGFLILLAFQLHHTGIKTYLILNLIWWRNQYFNCTIQELKRRYVSRPNGSSAISIAPYRN